MSIKKGKNKKIGNVMIILGIVLVIFIGLYFGILQETFAQKVYKADWGHICCEEGAYEEKYIRYLDDNPLYICNSYTDECRIKVHPDKDYSFLSGSKKYYYQYCDINGMNCGAKVTQSFPAPAKESESFMHYIDYGKSIKFSKVGIDLSNDLDNLVYEADYRKFYIQGEENGKVYIAKSCILNSDLKERVLAGGLNELSKTGANRCQNYIIGYVEVATNIYTYQGEDVICQARNIYEIDVLDMIEGESEKIQGERIKEVECCPMEPNCDEDFTFKEIVIKECDYSYQCANGGEPVMVTGTAYVTFDCIDNKCAQSDPVTVECTNNAICVDKLDKPNAVCIDFKCVLDDDWLDHCGDGECDSILGETPTSCPDDCGDYDSEEKLVCDKWYQDGSFSVKETCGFNPLCWVGISNPTIKKRCLVATWFWVAIGVLILLIIIASILLKREPRSTSGGRQPQVIVVEK